MPFLRLAILPLLLAALPAIAEETTEEVVAPPETAHVIEVFKASFADRCDGAIGGDPEDLEPNVYDMPYRDDWQDASEPDRQFRVYEFPCYAGAYNFASVYMSWDEIMGLQPISFPSPTLDVKYGELKDDDIEAPFQSLSVKGIEASTVLVNTMFDEETKSIVAVSYWRGMGDASSVARYEQEGPGFSLKTYDVDPTYDGEVNLFRVIDYTKPVPVPPVVLEEAVENSVTND